MANDAALATGLSVYAALEADAALNAAKEAEARAFMDAYTHRTATPSERQRYVEVVQAMYPAGHRHQEMSPMSAKLLGGLIVLVFLVPAAGAAYGWLWLGGDIGEGVMRFVGVALWAVLAMFGLAIFGVGLGLLFGVLT